MSTGSVTIIRRSLSGFQSLIILTVSGLQ